MAEDQPRVLMVLDALHIGGTEVHVYELVKQLQNMGVYVAVAARDGRLRPEFNRLGCPVYLLDFPNEHVPVESWGNTLGQLREIVQQQGITLVHAHQPISGRFGLRVAEERHLPFISTVHAIYSDVIPEATATIAVSHPVRRWLRKFGIHSRVIPNGIDTHLFRPRDKVKLRKQLGIPEKARVLLYVARLRERKADIAEDFIRVCRHLRETGLSVHGVIVGNGLEFDQIKKRADRTNQKFGRTFIHCVGHVDAIHKYYAASDCVVGTGRVALEGMACGKPVVATGEAGYYGTVRPSRFSSAWHRMFGDHDGYQKSDRKYMYRDIRPLLRSSSERRRIGRESRRFVKAKFDTRRVTKQIYRMYRKYS